jgi:hypothetical protein
VELSNSASGAAMVDVLVDVIAKKDGTRISKESSFLESRYSIESNQEEDVDNTMYYGLRRLVWEHFRQTRLENGNFL